MSIEELFGLSRTASAAPWLLLLLATLAALAVWAWSERRDKR